MIKVPAGQAPPRPGQQQVDITKTTTILCEKCGSDLFIPAFYMRKLSALISPDGENKIIPIQTFCCGNCGNINADFIPAFMLAGKELESKESKQVPEQSGAVASSVSEATPETPEQNTEVPPLIIKP